VVIGIPYLSDDMYNLVTFLLGGSFGGEL